MMRLHADTPDGEAGTYTPDAAYFRRLNADPNLMHVIVEEGRVGSVMFFRVLELDHFPPGTKLNDAYNLLDLKWEDIRWWVVSAPIRFEATVRRVADECGMRLADGIPHVFSCKGVAKFPLDSKTAYKLESKSGSMIYDGPAARDMIRTLELTKIKEVERRHYAWFDEQDEIHHRGRLWKRLKIGDGAPERVVDVMEMGQGRGAAKRSIWYTSDPRNPDWRPYPE